MRISKVLFCIGSGGLVVHLHPFYYIKSRSNPIEACQKVFYCKMLLKNKRK